MRIHRLFVAVVLIAALVFAFGRVEQPKRKGLRLLGRSRSARYLEQSDAGPLRIHRKSSPERRFSPERKPRTSNGPT